LGLSGKKDKNTNYGSENLESLPALGLGGLVFAVFSVGWMDGWMDASGGYPHAIPYRVLPCEGNWIVAAGGWLAQFSC
jgi:hypothetical protein